MAEFADRTLARAVPGPEQEAVARLAVLVVDAALDGSCLRAILGDSGFELLSATSVEDGLALARCRTPDCILLKHAVPASNALDMARLLQQADGHLPCAMIVLGAREDAALATAVMKAGALDYLPSEQIAQDLLREAIQAGVTRHRLNAEQRRRSQQNSHLAAIVAASTDAIVSLEADGARVRSWSRGATLLFGYAEGEAVGRTIDELIIPDHKGEERAGLLAAVSSGRQVVLETERRHKSGALVPVEINVSPMTWSLGQVIGYSVIFRDIRERRRAERAIRESQERLARREAELSRAQRIARIGSYEVEYRDGEFFNRRSPEYLSIHGLRPEDWNESHEAWVRRMHPDDRASSEKAFRKAIAEGTSEYETEYRIIRPSDGQIRWIKVLAEIDRDEGGAPTRLFGTHIDITERKQAEDALRASEARLRLSAEAARLGLFEIDWRGRRRHWSPELRAMLAVPEDLDISQDGDLITRIIPPEHQDRFRQRLARSFDPDGSAEYEDEHEVIRFDGSRCWVLLRGRTFFEEASEGLKPARTVGLMMDITERKLAERQRELLLRELDHRLKNVFATISSMIGLSSRSATSIDSYAASLRERIYALSAVHNLVRGADLDNGASLATIARTIAGRGFTDKIYVSGPELLVSATAAIAFGMILSELLTNAIKYGALSQPEGHVRLVWTASRGELELIWQESGGPEVVATDKTGFGTLMIKQNVAVIDGRLETDWRRDGIVITLACPLSRLD